MVSLAALLGGPNTDHDGIESTQRTHLSVPAVSCPFLQQLATVAALAVCRTVILSLATLLPSLPDTSKNPMVGFGDLQMSSIHTMVTCCSGNGKRALCQPIDIIYSCIAACSPAFARTNLIISETAPSREPAFLIP